MSSYEDTLARLKSFGLDVLELPDNLTPWAQLYVTDPSGNVVEFNVERGDLRRPHDRSVHASLLALTSAALYGAADFLGGVASKRLSTTVVVAVSQATGLVVLLAAISSAAAGRPRTKRLRLRRGRGLGWDASAWACCTARWPSA